MKKRLREGAELIVADPRRIDLVRSPHIEAAHHLPLLPGSNVAVVNAMGHVVVTEGLVDHAFASSRCEGFDEWAEFIAQPENSPETVEPQTGVPADQLRAAARLYASAGNAAIYYGLGVTEHSQGSTMVMGMANLAMATGNIGRDGVGVNPLRGQNNVQGSCDMGSFPHELPGYRHVSDDAVRSVFENLWGRSILPDPGLRIPNMFDAAIDGSFRGLFVQGEDIAQSDPNLQHVTAALSAMELVVVQDLFLNETAKFAHVFLPGASFLEKDGTFTNAERRINRVRAVMEPKAGKHEWAIVCEIATAMGYPMHYDHPGQIMDEIAATTPTFAGVSFERIDQVGSIQWPCNEESPEGTPVMHTQSFTRGLGRFMLTPFVPTTERSTRRFPLILTTGRILSQYNVGAQTRRTSNVSWHPEDILEIHPHDAEDRGVVDGDLVEIVEPGGAYDAPRADLGPGACGRRPYDVPPPPDRCQRRDDRELRLGNELPGVQGHRRAGRRRPRARRRSRLGGPRTRGRARVKELVWVSGPRRGWATTSPASSLICPLPRRPRRSRATSRRSGTPTCVATSRRWLPLTTSLSTRSWSTPPAAWPRTPLVPSARPSPTGRDPATPRVGRAWGSHRL